MSIKLIAIDIDGTLLDSTMQLRPKVKEALMKKSSEGVKIVLCSGRPVIGMKPFLEELSLNRPNEYVIGYNGALVQQTSDDKVIVEHTLTHQDFQAVAKLAEEISVGMHTMDLTTMYTPNYKISPYTVFDSFATKMPLEFRLSENMAEDMVISKIMFVEEPEKMEEAIKKIPKQFYESYHIVRSMPFFLEILHKKASKGNGLHDLATHLGIRQDEVMAIGDNNNDLDMLTYASIGVAMGNATKEAKEAADVITKTNDEDGVAHAIETWAN